MKSSMSSALILLFAVGAAVARPAEARAVVGIAVSVPAPPLRYGHVVAGAGRVWISGGWRWNSSRHAWAAEYWTRALPGMRHVPARWARTRPAWRFHAGYWSP